MLQAKIVAPKRIELEDVEIPKPGRGEVLVKVHYNAVCGSEFPAYLGTATRCPYYLGIVEYPVGPFGHEGTGEVVEVGPDVEDFRPGDLVAGCGGYAEYVTAPAENLVHIPEGLSTKDASLCIMVAETYYATRLLGLGPEDSVYISGMGPTGLALLEHIRQIGCYPIVCCDLMGSRLEVAKELGADFTVNPAEDPAARLREILPEGASVSIDTTGGPASIANVIKAASKFARVGLYGRPLERMRDFEDGGRGHIPQDAGPLRTEMQARGIRKEVQEDSLKDVKGKAGYTPTGS